MNSGQNKNFFKILKKSVAKIVRFFEDREDIKIYAPKFLYGFIEIFFKSMTEQKLKLP